MLEHALTLLEHEFSLSKEELLRISSLFQEHITTALSGRSSSLKMLPSYLGIPSGQEAGAFLALDFGGSNVRAAMIELNGNRQWLEASRVVYHLDQRPPGLNYGSESVTAEKLFDFLARIIQEVLSKAGRDSAMNSKAATPIPLGLTFSFPYHQRKLDQGILINWTKEVRTSGVVGKDIGELLSAALERLSLNALVKPVAIINDTTATLLAAAYQNQNVDIASIIGTGHNTCYLEQNAPRFGAPVIINTESGNFSGAPGTIFDQKLDLESVNTGEQKFEKMLSGKYLGELFRLVIQDVSNKEFSDTRWNQPYSITSKDLSQILKIDKNPKNNELLMFKQIASLLVKRSARLMASSLIGIVKHQDPALNRYHSIAIDGSLYVGIPGYAQELTSALSEGLESSVSRVTVKLFSGSSLTGAAIAAALATT